MPKPRIIFSAERILFATGAGTAVVGAVAALLWLLGSGLHLALGAQGMLMKFNTAISLLVAGVGHCALARRRMSVARIAGLLLLVVGAITFLQYPLHRSLGLDQLLLADRFWLPEHVSGPGRMAPNTAGVLALLGVILWSMARPNFPPRRLMILASIGLAISAIAVCGYATGLEYAFRWGRFTAMHFYTAVCFVALSLAQIGWAAKRRRAEGHRNPWSFPFFCTGGAMIVLLSSIVYATTLNDEAAGKWVSHTDEVLESLSGLERAVMGAEANFRGYLLQDPEDYRTMLANHELEAKQHLVRMTALTDDNPGQRARLSDLQRMSGENFVFLIEALGAPQVSGQDQTSLHHARELRRAVRAKIGEMRSEELGLRTERVARQEVASAQLRGTLIFGYP